MSGLILKILYFEKNTLLLVLSCSSMENNLLAASEEVEICPVVFRNRASVSNGDYK